MTVLRTDRDIKNFIRNARAEIGYSQIEFAMELGVTQQAVSSWENGKSIPSVLHFLSIAQLISVTIKLEFWEP